MMIDPDLRIGISSYAKEKFTKEYGNEVVLRCSCGDKPSHDMYYQNGSGKCPICKEQCEMIPYEWSFIND